MEDLQQLFELTEIYPRNMERLTKDWLVKLREILWGAEAAAEDNSKEMPAASPRQMKKRVKRLSSLNEEDTEDPEYAKNNNSGQLSKGEEQEMSPPKIKRSDAGRFISAKSMGSSEEDQIENCALEKKTSDDKPQDSVAERRSEATSLMPPPPAPTSITPAAEPTTGRPQRAAKLKSEKCLKEPKLNVKVRRPTEDDVKIKLESEQRASQMHDRSGQNIEAKISMNSTKSNDSIIVVPTSKTSTVNISSNSEDEEGVSSVADTSTKKKSTGDNTTEGEGTIRESLQPGTRELRVKIKREKVSIQPQQDENRPPSKDATFKAPAAVPQIPATSRSNSSTLEETGSVLSTTTNTSTVPGKRGRKKKEPHKPIKVERFSDLDPKPAPVASRTRNGSTCKPETQTEGEEKDAHPQTELSIGEDANRPGSVYEDAVEMPPTRNSKQGLINETVTLASYPASDATINPGNAAGDATFCANPGQTTFQVAPGQTTFIVDAVNPNATITLNKNSGAPGDVTFEVNSTSKNDKENDITLQKSFETAKDSSVPNNDCLITDDESCGPSPPRTLKQKAPPTVKPSQASSNTKGVSSAKSSYKVPTRTNELFNPLAQSPVKLRVEAFENAAASAAADQPKRPLRNRKEDVTPTSVITPIIGKLPVPALGRFLTPTQSSNISLTGSALAKKLPTSASKAMPFPKSSSSSLQRSNSNVSTKTLQRENSADDFRKGLHTLAEERKKQREQKHLQAAQLREAKERERSERIAKLAREKEEKRKQKQQEKLDQQKRELEDIQRKLRLQQEEEAKIKAAKEREMAMAKQQQLLAKQKMMPPPPKTATKYTFEMLHEDDSTDDENKVSYKRPPPPSWSRSHRRGPFVLKQEYIPSCYVDSLFSVQPMTPDLKQIFPNIDARHLKRNSSVLWSTPPRYSELPKY